MNEQEIRKYIHNLIQEMLEGGEIEENLFHVTPTNQNVVTAVIPKIEAVFPNYSEETGEFVPQKVTVKQY